ncbi:MAG: hypothetical protein CVU77_02240 [Elusimicrobia bacterium HGW-Elusimicrobia-1]|nr:MAG: hypothetical protein CVU77_02240 [Elusimicrobia bacterium HGW-Elusimicrobia-1]
MKSFLVTGAGGFIGTRITETLLSRGHKVFCLVRNLARAEHLTQMGAVVVRGDVTDPVSLRAVMEKPAFGEGRPDAVINSAGVLRSRDMARYYAVNSAAVASMGAIARTIGTKVVHLSSLAAFGPSEPGKPRRLGDRPSPVSVYGRSKLDGTLALAASGARHCVIVPSAVYGPRDRDMFFFFKAVSLGISVSSRPPRFINMSFSEDVALAVALAAETDRADGKTYYAADPKEYSWSDVCEIIAAAAKKSVLRVIVPDFILSSAALVSEKISSALGKDAVFNTDKANEMLRPAWTCSGVEDTQKDLGFRMTDFADGAAKTYNWYKENHWL